MSTPDNSLKRETRQRRQGFSSFDARVDSVCVLRLDIGILPEITGLCIIIYHQLRGDSSINHLIRIPFLSLRPSSLDHGLPFGTLQLGKT